MGIFDPAWKKLHIKICRAYEDIAIENFSGGPIDFLEVTTKALVKSVPEFSEKEAREFIEDEYKSYKKFDIYPIFSTECFKRNPNISKPEVKEIFEGVKKRFLKQESEHEYFLFFVVSKIIEMKKIGITRCSYLIEIARGNKPKISGFFRRAINLLSTKG